MNTMKTWTVYLWLITGALFLAGCLEQEEEGEGEEEIFEYFYSETYQGFSNTLYMESGETLLIHEANRSIHAEVNINYENNYFSAEFNEDGQPIRLAFNDDKYFINYGEDNTFDYTRLSQGSVISTTLDVALLVNRTNRAATTISLANDPWEQLKLLAEVMDLKTEEVSIIDCTDELITFLRNDPDISEEDFIADIYHYDFNEFLTQTVANLKSRMQENFSMEDDIRDFFFIEVITGDAEVENSEVICPFDVYIKGEISEEVKYNITYGICYSKLEELPTINHQQVSENIPLPDADLPMPMSIYDVESGSTYYYRSFLRYNNYVVYGEVKTFQTAGGGVEPGPTNLFIGHWKFQSADYMEEDDEFADPLVVKDNYNGRLYWDRDDITHYSRIEYTLNNSIVTVKYFYYDEDLGRWEQDGPPEAVKIEFVTNDILRIAGGATYVRETDPDEIKKFSW